MKTVPAARSLLLVLHASGIQQLATLLPTLSWPLTAAATLLVLLSAAFPVDFALAAGQLVGAVPAAVRDGLQSAAGRGALQSLAVAGALFSTQRAIAPIRIIVASVFGQKFERPIVPRQLLRQVPELLHVPRRVRRVDRWVARKSPRRAPAVHRHSTADPPRTGALWGKLGEESSCSVAPPYARRGMVRANPGSVNTLQTRALALLARDGLLLMSDPALPSIVALVAGAPVRGSWWGHPQGRTIYTLANRLIDHPDVLLLKLVAGKDTFVHRSLWSTRAYATRAGVVEIAALLPWPAA